jgi:ribokinase
MFIAISHSYVDRMPKAGETIHSQTFEIGFGGKGSNQAIAASRLGCKTSMIGKVGDDPYGKSYKEHFVKEGIDVEFLEMVNGAYSGIALIVVDAVDGNNQIVINANANESLSVQDVVKAKDKLNRSKVC